MAHCAGSSLSDVISQDLPPLGEGGALESGDSIEMKYTGWILQDNTYGSVRICVHVMNSGSVLII